MFRLLKKWCWFICECFADFIRFFDVTPVRKIHTSNTLWKNNSNLVSESTSTTFIGGLFSIILFLVMAHFAWLLLDSSLNTKTDLASASAASWSANTSVIEEIHDVVVTTTSEDTQTYSNTTEVRHQTLYRENENDLTYHFPVSTGLSFAYRWQYGYHPDYNNWYSYNPYRVSYGSENYDTLYIAFCNTTNFPYTDFSAASQKQIYSGGFFWPFYNNATLQGTSTSSDFYYIKLFFGKCK